MNLHKYAIDLGNRGTNRFSPESVVADKILNLLDHEYNKEGIIKELEQWQHSETAKHYKAEYLVLQAIEDIRSIQ